MPDPAPPILVVGSTMIDLIAYADVLPEAGQTIVGTGFAMGFGGKGANQAVAAARLGARVAMVNCLGEDSYGADTLRNFEAQGVDAHLGAAGAGLVRRGADLGRRGRDEPDHLRPGRQRRDEPGARGRGVRRGRPVRRRRPVRDAAGDDRRRVRARPGRRRDHGPQPGAGSPDRGRGHRVDRLARPQRARVRADRRRDARRRRGGRGRRAPRRSRSAWTSRSS